MLFLSHNMIFILIAFVVGLSFHEFGHALAAFLVGDDTAKRQGRLTLNPLVHLDLIGFIVVIFAGFGWARPVVFDPRRIRGNVRVGIIFIALAGPLMNLFLAVISGIVLVSFNMLTSSAYMTGLGQFVFYLFLYMMQLNVALAIFNLIPIPPLDGWQILHHLMPRKMYLKTASFERFGMIILLIFLISPLGSSVIGTTTQYVLNAWFRNF
ncbi:site-2 protease family protein [Ferroacidibacillus organovorans]|uniref:Peptidase M50 domain-containing protein n=1 Tax=Ferroacidibacillus organovorans TaxID=1765683 RepID=A0A853KCB4_9BACL|nr:site-2 protease family protein [Ferroacidibacillus organovorans]OAG94676.1 hypothetical protein AYW79_03775 [Ferroacidibacillus organovorans]